MTGDDVLEELPERYAKAYANTGLSTEDIYEEILCDYRAGFDALYDHDRKRGKQLQKAIDLSIKRNAGARQTSKTSAAQPSGQKYSTEPSEKRPTKVLLSPDKSIEEENIRKGNAAVKMLIEAANTAESPQNLVVSGAMRRTDLGPIDLVWGAPGTGKNFKHGYGLSHIIARRNAENGNGEAVAHKIVEVIAKAKSGDIQRGSTPGKERIRLYYDGYTAVHSKTQGGNSWLLTGWENNESSAYAAGEGHNSSGATADAPTFTRRTGGNAADSERSVEEKNHSVKRQSGGIQRRNVTCRKHPRRN